MLWLGQDLGMGEYRYVVGRVGFKGVGLCCG